MQRVYKDTQRVGDENLYYGVNPVTKGVAIKQTGNSDTLSISFNGSSAREVASNAISTSALSDPNYFGSGTWLPAPLIEFNNNGVIKPGEEVICTITNLSSNLTDANPNDETIYTWTPNGDTSSAITGVQVRLQLTQDTTWEVIGRSSTIGETEPTIFTILVDDAEAPIPLVQTITNEPNGASTFKVLNFAEFTGTVVTFEIYETDPNSPEESFSTETFNYRVPNALGIYKRYIRAVIDGTPTESRELDVIVTEDPETVKNFRASFSPVNPGNRLPLLDLTGFGEYGTTGYFEVVMYTEEREIQLVNVHGAKLTKPGTYYARGLVEVEFIETATDYNISFEYLVRTKGTVGGIRYVSNPYEIRGVNGTPYNFQMSLPEELQAGEDSSLRVTDEFVSEKGYYQYSINTAGITGMGLAVTESTRFEMDQTVRFTAPSGNQLYNVVITIYNIAGQVVKTLTHGLNITSSSITVRDIDSGDTDRFGVEVSVTGSPGGGFQYYMPSGLPYLGESYNLNGMYAFDVFDINNPRKLTQRLQEYNFPGSEKYQFEFYREIDVASYLSQDNPDESLLNSYRRINLDLNVANTRLLSCDARIVSSGNATFTDRQPVIWDNTYPTPPGVGRKVGYFEAAGAVNLFYQTDDYNSLNSTVQSIKDTIPPGTYDMYLVGPNEVIFLAIPIVSAAQTTIRGKTIIEWTDASNTTIQYLSIDPDNVVDDVNKSEFIAMDGDFTYKVVSLTYGATLHVRGAEI